MNRTSAAIVSRTGDRAWPKDAIRRRLEYLLYICLAITMLVFWSFVYGRGMLPAFSYLKDILLIGVGSITLINALLRRSQIRVNRIDLLVWLLFIYLMFQLAYTAARIGSLPLAYLGFRLDFMPIILYFGFRRLEVERYRYALHRLFLCLLIIGASVTLIELALTWGGVISADFLNDFIGRGFEERRGITLGFVPRVFGIAGTPHITGIYNLVLVAILLYWPKSTRGRGLALPRPFRRRRGAYLLMLLAVTATMLSTSKTAWFILLFIVMLTVLGQRRVGRKAATLMVAISLLLYGLIFITEEQREFVIDFQLKYATSTYLDWLADWTGDVIRDHPLLGYGYVYETKGSPFEGRPIPLENQPLAADIYFAELFRMLGGIGLTLFALLFWLIPLQLVFSRRCSMEGRGAALGVLCVGLAFAHYSPLTSPVMSSGVWYLIALMSREWSASARNRVLAKTRPIESVTSSVAVGRSGIQEAPTWTTG